MIFQFADSDLKFRTDFIKQPLSLLKLHKLINSVLKVFYLQIALIPVHIHNLLDLLVQGCHLGMINMRQFAYEPVEHLFLTQQPLFVRVYFGEQQLSVRLAGAAEVGGGVDEDVAVRWICV